MANVQKGAIGVEITVTVPGAVTSISDILSGTGSIILQPEGGTVITRTATLATGAINATLSYTTIANDLSTSGSWRIQGRITTPTVDLKTSIGTFIVADNL